MHQPFGKNKCKRAERPGYRGREQQLRRSGTRSSIELAAAAITRFGARRNPATAPRRKGLP